MIKNTYLSIIPLSFSVQDRKPPFVIPAAFQILYWTHGVARTWKSSLSLPMFTPLFVWIRLVKNARQVQIRKCFPQPWKERLDEGRGRKTLSEIEIGFLFHQKRRRGWPTVRLIWREQAFSKAVVWLPGPLLVLPAGLLGRIAVFGLCLPFLILIKNSGLARESAGNKRKGSM